jgi:hypothetical protein
MSNNEPYCVNGFALKGFTNGVALAAICANGLTKVLPTAAGPSTCLKGLVNGGYLKFAVIFKFSAPSCC